jgi:integrase
VFKKAAIKADLPNITFHDLRRTHATILIASGASQKVVQERLGHRSISTTLALYAQGQNRDTLTQHLQQQNTLGQRMATWDCSGQTIIIDLLLIFVHDRYIF